MDGAQTKGLASSNHSESVVLAVIAESSAWAICKNNKSGKAADAVVKVCFLIVLISRSLDLISRYSRYLLKMSCRVQPYNIPPKAHRL